MATNLRLRPELESALRAAAERTGRSQQELIRAALDAYLHEPTTTVRPAPRTPLMRAQRRLRLPAGSDSTTLLDRGDRL